MPRSSYFVNVLAVTVPFAVVFGLLVLLYEPARQSSRDVIGWAVLIIMISGVSAVLLTRARGGRADTDEDRSV